MKTSEDADDTDTVGILFYCLAATVGTKCVLNSSLSLTRFSSCPLLLTSPTSHCQCTGRCPKAVTAPGQTRPGLQLLLTEQCFISTVMTFCQAHIYLLMSLLYEKASDGYGAWMRTTQRRASATILSLSLFVLTCYPAPRAVPWGIISHFQVPASQG